VTAAWGGMLQRVRKNVGEFLDCGPPATHEGVNTMHVEDCGVFRNLKSGTFQVYIFKSVQILDNFSH